MQIYLQFVNENRTKKTHAVLRESERGYVGYFKRSVFLVASCHKAEGCGYLLFDKHIVELV